MVKRGIRGLGERLLLVDAIAVLAAATCLVVAAASLLVAGLLGASSWPSAWQALLQLFLPPLVVGAVLRLVLPSLIAARLDPAVDAVRRFIAHDFTTPAEIEIGSGTGKLAKALEACRTTLGARHSARKQEERERENDSEELARSDAALRAAVKVHAAISRLMDGGIGRLSKGDLSARITLDLPPQFAGMRANFNGAMDSLEKAFIGVGGAAGRLRERAQEIEEASELLARRAGKLADRLDQDLEAGMRERNAEKALRMLLHTMNGARIATRRNAQAAEHFAGLGSLIAREASRIADIARSFGATPEKVAGSIRMIDFEVDAKLAALESRGLPPATVPANMDGPGLKFEAQPAA